MDIGKITKGLVCTIKDLSMNPAKIFIVKLINLDKSEKSNYIVAVDNGLGLGVGDIVLVVSGSSSRLLTGNSKMPIDCAISAKVESINIDKKYKFLL